MNEEMVSHYMGIVNKPDFKPALYSQLDNTYVPTEVPLRVDLFGGWLDKFPQSNGFVGSVTITPKVSLTEWDYAKQAGLGGSAAWSILNGYNSYTTESEQNCGWQDPAILNETGLCVFKSGNKPELVIKRNVNMLCGRLALFYTGCEHKTKDLVYMDRNYFNIAIASAIGMEAIEQNNFFRLCTAVNMTYDEQIREGMVETPDFGESAKKYCGSGHGGYVVYLFNSKIGRDKAVTCFNLKPIEPYIEQR